jgi:hypothetical protein
LEIEAEHLTGIRKCIPVASTVFAVFQIANLAGNEDPELPNLKLELLSRAVNFAGVLQIYTGTCLSFSGVDQPNLEVGQITCQHAGRLLSFPPVTFRPLHCLGRTPFSNWALLAKG